MYCSNCVMHLEALEDEIAGILSIQGSFQKQHLVVEYDETLTDEVQICAVIVYFTTPDCVACKVAQRPALSRLQQIVGQDQLQIIEINAYEKPKLAEDWGVLSVPTTFILDSSGTLRQVNHGVTLAKKLFEKLQRVLTCS